MAPRMTKSKMYSYMRNVGRSFGYAMVDSVKSMNPTVTALFKTTAEQSRDLYQSVKNFDAKSLGFEDSDLKGTLGQAVRDLKNNALDDIRTGKWYNKERIDRYNTEMAEDMFGINFDDFGNFDDFNFDDTELDEEASITEDATKATVKAMDEVGGKVSGAVSTAAIKSADYIVESNRINTKAMFGLTQAGFSQVNKGVAAMNGNLQLLVSLAEPITTHIQNSALFYTKSQEYQNKSLEYLKQIAANTSPKSSNSYRSSSRGKSYTDFVTAEGIIDIAALFENGTKKMKENTEMITSMLSFVPGGEKAILKMATASPLQFALTSVIGGLFSMEDKQGNSIKKSFESFNKVLSNFSLGLLGKAKRATFGDTFLSPFLRTLRDLILPENKVIKKPNTGAYEKGKVDWDGMSRKALMDVIPTQLSQILSALTGEEERRFDYNSGRWVTVRSVVNKRREDTRKMTNNAGGDLFKTISKSVNNSNMSKSDKKEYQRQLEAFLEYAVMSGNDSFLDILSFTDQDFKKFGMSGSVGRDLQKRIRAIGGTRKGAQQLSGWAGNVYNARNKVSSYNSNLTGADLSLFDKSNKRGGKSNLLDLKDEYGFSQNDYLRTILEHVSYIAKNLKNLVGKPGVGGVNQDGTRIKWESGDKITPSSNRTTRMDSSVDTIKEVKIKGGPTGIDEALADSSGPGYSTDEKKVLAKYDNDPEKIPDNEPLRDKILEKYRLYNAGQQAKGFVRSAYERVRGGDDSFLAKMEKELELSTENVSTALDKMSQGLNDFIFDKEKGLYSLMNTMTMGVLDMMKELIPRPIREGLGKLWGKFKSSDFGQATFGTLRDIGLSFFGGNNESAGQGSGLYRNISRTTQRMYDTQYSGGNFWNDFERNYSAQVTPVLGYAGGASRRAKGKGRKTKKKNKKAQARTDEAAASDAEDVISDADAEVATESLLNKIASKVGSALLDKISGVIGNIDPNKEKEQVKGTMQKLMEEAGLGKGAIGAGAFIGAGASILTGAFVGPIAGAAIGAAAGFVAKSETAQKMLFGEWNEEKGEYTGKSLFPKEVGKFFKKNGAATGKGAGVGMAIGTVMGSPILGAILGATAGYVSSSDKAKKAIFGDMESGEEEIIPLSLQKTLKEKFKFFAGGIGAALLLAPGPLIPKIAIGATLGAIIGKDNGKGFKEWLFGDGKDDKGFLGFTNERLFKPIIGTIDKAFNILTKSLQDKLTQLVRGFGKFLKDRLAKSKLGGKVLQAGEALGNFAKRGLKSAVDIAGSPFRAANRALEKKALRQGYAYRGEDNQYLTSAQRLAQYKLKNPIIPEGADEDTIAEIMAENDKKFTYRETGSSLVDQYLANEASKMSDAQYRKMIENLKAAEKGGDLSNNATIQAILSKSQHGMSKLGYKDITHALQQAEIDKNARDRAKEEDNAKKDTVEFNVKERIPSLIEQVVTGIYDLDADIRSKLGLPPRPGVKTSTDNSNPTGDTVDNTEAVYDEEGNPLVSSNAGREKINERKGFLAHIANLPIIGTGVDKLVELAQSIKGEIAGDGEKKPGLIDKLKGLLFGDGENGGLLSGILGFFTGSTGIGGVVGKILGKFSLQNLIPMAMKGVGLFALYKLLHGDFDDIGKKIPTGSNDPNGDNGLTDTWSKENQKKQGATQKKNDNNGDRSSDDETEATTDLDYYTDVDNNRVRVGSDNKISTRVKKNLASGLIMGKSSVVTASIKKITGLDITTKGLTKTLSTVAKNGIEASTINSICSSLGSIFGTICRGLTKLPVIGKKITDPNSIAAGIVNKLRDYITKIGSSATLKKAAGLLSNALVAIKVGYIAGRMIDGWGNAESTLGITETATIGQRFIAALIAGANAAMPFIGDLIPDKVLVDIFMWVAEQLGLEGVEGLQAQREKATEDVAAYIEETGDDTMTIEKYNQLGYTRNADGTFTQGKARAGAITKIKMKAGGFIDNVKDKGFGAAVSETFGNVGEKISGATDKVVNSTKKVFEIVKKQIFDADIDVIKSGNIGNLFKVEGLPEDSPISGFAKAAIIGGRIVMFPRVLVANLAKSIGETVVNLGKNLANTISHEQELTSQEREKVEDIMNSDKSTIDKVKSFFTDIKTPQGVFPGLFKAATIVRRITVFPGLLVSSIGQSIGEWFDNTVAHIRDRIDTFTAAESKIFEYVKEGDIVGLVKQEISDRITDGNPVGGFLGGIYNSSKVVMYLPTLVSAVGHKIADGINNIIEENKSNQEILDSAYKGMKEMADQGNVKGVRNLANPFEKKTGVLAFANNVGFGIGRIFYTISAMVHKLMEPIRQTVESVQNWMGDKAEGVSEWWGGVKNYWSNFGQTVHNSLTYGEVGAVNYDTDTRYSGGSSVVSQYDPRYRRYSVGGRSFAANGCGPASAVMATGGNLGDAVRIAQRYQTVGGTDAAYFGEMFNRRGQKAHYYLAGGASLVGDIASGKPTVLMGQDVYNTSKRYSPFGPNNHYVVANGFDGSGNILISDPEQRGVRRYNPSILRNVKVGISGGASNSLDMLSDAVNAKYGNSEIGSMAATNSEKTIDTWVDENKRSQDRKKSDAILKQQAVDDSYAINTKNSSGTSSTGTGTGAASDNISQIWGYLKSLGFNDYASAGIMGCWQCESKNNPDTLEGNYALKEDAKSVLASNAAMNNYTNRLFAIYDRDNVSYGKSGYYGDGKGVTDTNLYPGYGLAQWTGPRLKTYIDWAKNAGYDHRNLLTQLEYFRSEYDKRPNYQKSAANASSIEEGTIAALDDFEMHSGWHNQNATGKKQYSDRLAQAKNIYAQMNGLPGTYPDGMDGALDIGDGSDKDATNAASKEGTGGKKFSIGGVLTAVTSAFANAFSKLFNGEDVEESESNSGSSNYSSGGRLNISGTDPVSYMEAMKNKITYTFGAKDPEGGKADCSGTVNWAIKKASGIDIGGDTLSMYNNTKNLKSIWYNNGQYASSMPADAKRNDVLLFSRPDSSFTSGRPDRVGHVALYTGEGNKFIEIGQGTGTYESTLSHNSKLIKVARLIDENGNEIDFDNQGLTTIDSEAASVATGKKGSTTEKYDTAKRAQDRKKSDKLLNEMMSGGSGSGLLNYGPSRAGNYILRDNTRNYFREGAGASVAVGSDAISMAGGNLLSAAKNVIKGTSKSARQGSKDLGTIPENVSVIKDNTSEMTETLNQIATAVKQILANNSTSGAGSGLKDKNNNNGTTIINTGSNEKTYPASEELRDIVDSIITSAV